MYKDWHNVKFLQKVIIFNSENKVLAIKRVLSDKARAGKWDLPGGNIEEGDYADKSLKNIHENVLYREVFEETGLKIDNMRPLYVGSGIKSVESVGNILILAIIYQSNLNVPIRDVTLSSEHYEYNWFTIDELKKLDFGDELYTNAINNITK
jgi:8-oxo-dGTP pyrophosphatase MutT (NUDIX family)